MLYNCFQCLVRVCGEVKAAPSENEEIQFLCTVVAKVKTDPYLVNFFIEVSDISHPGESLYFITYSYGYSLYSDKLAEHNSGNILEEFVKIRGGGVSLTATV